MATSSTLNFGEQNKELFQAPVLEIGALLTDSYFQETPRSIHAGVTDYTGIDIFPGNGVDRVLNLCRTEEIPQHWQNHFGTIHCHCVLEHVTDIFTMSKNIDTITKPGGVLYLTVPFVWKIHRIPLDLWRFTPQSIDYLFPNFEFKKELCRVATRKNIMSSIDEIPELNLGNGLEEENPFLKYSLKFLRKFKFDRSYFMNRALFPEINLIMIGIKKEKPNYTFIDSSDVKLL
jgi:SAM-dependent methyltransferase